MGGGGGGKAKGGGNDGGSAGSGRGGRESSSSGDYACMHARVWRVWRRSGAHGWHLAQVLHELLLLREHLLAPLAALGRR